VAQCQAPPDAPDGAEHPYGLVVVADFHEHLRQERSIGRDLGIEGDQLTRDNSCFTKAVLREQCVDQQ
jgi:hypothetical protein